MQTAWNHWKFLLAARLSEQLETAIAPDEFVVPPDASLGDFAYPCFRLAKEHKTSPAEIAKQIAEAYEAPNGLELSSVTAAGPYVNFSMAIGDTVHRVIRDIEVTGDDYGREDAPTTDRILFEYANPNTHKEIHIGHLRNIVLGVSLLRIMKGSGMPVIPVSYINDVGSNVGKSVWFLVMKSGFEIRSFDEKQAKTLLASVAKEDRNGRFLGGVYTEATQYVDEHPEEKDDISFVQQQLESHAPAWESVWQETRRWCLDEMGDIFKELGVEIERQYFESEILDRSHHIVDELIQQGIAIESQGAIIVDLDERKLGAFLLRKTDGTLLYAAKDVALAELKNREYPQVTQSLLLVDSRQSLYFKQLFETLGRIGLPQHFEQVGYEIVTLKEGVMSSRKGNVITYQAFRDTVAAYAKNEILKRHADWNEGKVAHTAWALAMAGIKFTMLKQDSDKTIIFDMEQALSFDGCTGPYCQYAATRLASILRKSGNDVDTNQPLTRDYDHASEKRLAFVLAQFPSVLQRSAVERKPSHLAQWCFDVAQRVNEFYRDVPVLEAPGDLREGRLRLAHAARTSLERGLHLLGIPLPDEM